MVEAFGYLRVSGLGQVDGDGFTRQREAIQAFCVREGLEVVRWFEERGVSGTKDTLHRPAWGEMIDAIESNGVRVVVFEALDRLARDLMIQEAIVGEARKRGIELRSVYEPELLTDDSDPTRKLLRRFMGMIAEHVKDMLVAKLKGAREREKAKTGRCEGRRPYGWYEGEKATLQQILELGRLGTHYSEIANALNDTCQLTRSGRPWLPNTVRRILERNGRV